MLFNLFSQRGNEYPDPFVLHSNNPSKSARFSKMKNHKDEEAASVCPVSVFTTSCMCFKSESSELVLIALLKFSQ